MIAKRIRKKLEWSVSLNAVLRYDDTVFQCDKYFAPAIAWQTAGNLTN